MKGRVGMGSLGDLPTDKILEYAVLAERNEFDSIWIAGHILYRDPFGLLSAVATRTSKIKLGVGVTSAYARPIATLAMNVATLDEISKGRVLLGIGTQIRFWNQLGVMDKRPLATLRKTINILRRILAGENITFADETINISNGKLEFEPWRREIPIYIGAIGPKMLELAGEIADGVILSSMCSPDYVKYASSKIKNGARKVGRKPDDIDVACYILTWASKDDSVVLPSVKKWIASFVSVKGREIMLDKNTYDDIILNSIRRFVREGKFSEASELVTEEMIRSVSVSGEGTEFRAKLKKYLSAGVKLPIILPIVTDLKSLISFLE